MRAPDKPGSPLLPEVRAPNPREIIDRHFPAHGKCIRRSEAPKVTPTSEADLSAKAVRARIMEALRRANDGGVVIRIPKGQAAEVQLIELPKYLVPVLLPSGGPVKVRCVCGSVLKVSRKADAFGTAPDSKEVTLPGGEVSYVDVPSARRRKAENRARERANWKRNVVGPGRWEKA